MQDLGALAIVFIFGIIVLVFATFVSHTVAALIILPIVQQVGEKLTPPHPNLLVMVKKKRHMYRNGFANTFLCARSLVLSVP